VGLPAGFAKRYPAQLSGGEQQRVGVARALAADPPVMLMDEPFSAVDPVVREQLQDEFLRLQSDLGKTIVFVTHDIDEAIKLGDRVALFNPNGTIAQYATPAELLARPASDYVEGFLGAGRLVRRLGLIPLRSITIPTHNGHVPPQVEVDISATLRDALDGVLRDPNGVVAIKDGDRTVGVLNAATIVALGR
jgi:osmoprotectant transport system ATP-binding protein